MIRDAAVVEDARLVLEARAEQARGRARPVLEALAGLRIGAGEGRERLAHRRAVVVRQAARGGTRVGQQLVPLVEALRGRERAPRRPAEAPVALALKTGEVEQRRRGFLRGLAGLLGAAGLARDARHDRLRARLVEDAVVARFLVGARLEIRVVPLTGVGRAGVLEARAHAPVGARLVRQDLELALDEHAPGSASARAPPTTPSSPCGSSAAW